jgi:subtilase family serine protease
MFRFRARLACAATLFVFMGSSGTGQMAVKDRILRPIDSTQTTVVRGTEHPLAKPEIDRGRIDPSQAINATLVFRLSATQQADLDRLLRDQQTPSSPRYHQWLTPEQYADRFGMSRNDLAKISAWLQSQGLPLNGVSRGRTEISFSGSAGTVEAAFQTELHRYVVRGQEHFANSRAVSVPQAFADVVLGVRGLDDFRPKPMVRTQSNTAANPRFTSDLSGNHFLNPADFAVIYHLNPLYSAGLDGTGIKIAVTGQSPLTSSGNSTTDLDAFRAASGLAAKDPTAFVVAGAAPKFNSGDAVEADLDLEWSNAVAPNADVTFVYSVSAFDALTYAVNHNVAPIISNSFGLCEADLGGASEQSLWQTVRQGNAQGQTVVTATGDAGAADCDGDASTVPKSASKGLSVDVPAAIPEVTGIGGTEFTGDSSQCPLVNGSNVCSPTPQCPNGFAPADSTFWASGCVLTSPAATAQEYIPEKAWNDTTLEGQLSAGGGGASIFFGKPSWQAGSGVPADGARDVPDVALNASPSHDPYLICSAGRCVNGYRDPNDTKVPNSLDAVGGTSAGAPTFAGILALILQATKQTGLGNVNPMLYSLAASSPSAFHDIAMGDNKVPCVSGTTNCPAGTTTIGFSAGPGYDQATGLGSVDADALETAWLAAIASPPADFLIDGQSSTVTPGQSGSATVNVTATNGFADTLNLTCQPSNSSTSAQITCALSPTSVTLSSSSKTGSSTLSLKTVATLDPPQLPHSRGTWFAATGGLLAAVLLGGIPSRRRWLGLLSLVLVAIAIGSVGCGGGGGSSSTPQQKQQGTPAGTYAITIAATGANTGTSHSIMVNLIVK